MPRRDPAASPPAFLGDELRRARIGAGYSSQEALAAKLGFDRTVITKAETGERPPTPEVLEAWSAACGFDPDLFGRLAALARSADGPVPTWFEDWLSAEREALTLRIWQPIIVPGLLQTADYARALSCPARWIPQMNLLRHWFRLGWNVSRYSAGHHPRMCWWSWMSRY